MEKTVAFFSENAVCDKIHHIVSPRAVASMYESIQWKRSPSLEMVITQSA